MSKLTFGEVNDVILDPLKGPRPTYFLVMGCLAIGVLWAVAVWIYQVKVGMGITGLNHPVGWAVYITNFVFWVGIAHSGTLISAILHLVRSRWRVSVARSAEAMTVFAVMTAGLFPLIHLGRLWVFYYIIPYPSERQLWPNFISPLVWDVVAVTTYLIVSSTFWIIGLLPDLASARDRLAARLGWDHPRTRFYAKFCLGWKGSGRQWWHHGRGYLFFAALATPLVISVHSVVSWDFAASLLPGWHTTIFAPYFVAGAIHSGLAMVLTLVIPMRRFLKLEKVITINDFESVAQTMIVTTMIVAYAYVMEPFIAWYSGDLYEKQFAWWRATGTLAWIYWALWLCNVLVPLGFLFKRVRRNLKTLFVISIFVNIGMWLERVLIIMGSLSHDFLPHNWWNYAPRWPELSITAGAFCFFLLWFFGFGRTIPTVSISDVKEDREEGTERYHELDTSEPRVQSVRRTASGLMAVYCDAGPLLEALAKVRKAGFDAVETYSPVRMRKAEEIMGRGPSPVRYWTLGGALLGCISGFWLAIGSALVNSLVVGAKMPVSIIPYCVVGFEGTILLGTLGNLTGLLIHGRLGRHKLRMPPGYDGRFTRDRFGLFVECTPAQGDSLRKILANEAEAIHAIE